MPPPNQVLKLIERFERCLDEYKRPDHKEARVRAEFIDSVLESLAWDVRNVQGRGEQRILPLHQKLAAAAIPADKYEPSIHLYQRQIESADRQVDALAPARQQAGASCMDRRSGSRHSRDCDQGAAWML
jgi:hypothetical protein